MNKLTTQEIGKIAEEAYIYAFPMLMGYRFAFASFLMPGIPSYRGPANTLTGKAATFDHTLPTWPLCLAAPSCSARMTCPLWPKSWRVTSSKPCRLIAGRLLRQPHPMVDLE